MFILISRHGIGRKEIAISDHAPNDRLIESQSIPCCRSTHN